MATRFKHCKWHKAPNVWKQTFHHQHNDFASLKDNFISSIFHPDFTSDLKFLFIVAFTIEINAMVGNLICWRLIVRRCCKYINIGN